MLQVPRAPLLLSAHLWGEGHLFWGQFGMVWATNCNVGWAEVGLSHTCLSSAPAIEPSRVENVLVPCAYSPTYVVKDFPIARYQGLQFVSVSL